MADGTKAILALLMLTGCAHPAGPIVVTDPDPSIKIPATANAVREHDKSAIPQLIKDLESDDPAVRLYASHALYKLTEKTFGYRYYDTDDSRFAAVNRWRQWYQHQWDGPTTAATQLP